MWVTSPRARAGKSDVVGATPADFGSNLLDIRRCRAQNCSMWHWSNCGRDRPKFDQFGSKLAEARCGSARAHRNRPDWDQTRIITEHQHCVKLPTAAAAELAKTTGTLVTNASALKQHASDRNLYNDMNKFRSLRHLACFSHHVTPRLGWCYATNKYMGQVQVAKSCLRGTTRVFGLCISCVPFFDSALHVPSLQPTHCPARLAAQR